MYKYRSDSELTDKKCEPGLLFQKCKQSDSPLGFSFYSFV